MFGKVLTIVVTVIHVYVFWRLAAVPSLRRSAASRAAVVGAGIALWGLFAFGRFTGHAGLPPLLELLGMDWMGILFLLFVPLAVVDLGTGFGRLFPRPAGRLRSAALALGGGLAVVALVQGARAPVVQEHEVRLAGLPRELDGTVVVALSDTHLGTLLDGRWLEARAEQVRALDPDMIVLAGDILEGHGHQRGEFLPGLRRLSAPLGVWAVLGNHEYHGSISENIGLLRDAGFHVLRNEAVSVRPGLVVAGVDDLTHQYRRRRDGDYLAAALSERPSGATILISHTPWQTDRAAAAGVGLMVCGHTHGGQIWPFGHLVRRRYPLFEGRYAVGGMTVLVCRGTGSWGPRMRLWRPAEILRVTLRSGGPDVPGSRERSVAAAGK